MKKIIILSIFLIILFCGCDLLDFEPEYNYVVDTVVNADENNQEEVINTNDEDESNNNVIEETEEENINGIKEKEEESEEELTIDQVFKGTWWMYMEYPDFLGLSVINISAGKFDSGGNYEGKMTSIKGTIYEKDFSEAVESEPTGEIINYEIDGQKIRFSVDGGFFYGRLKLDKQKSYASGSFDSTFGSGTWYMTNVESDDNWDNL